MGTRGHMIIIINNKSYILYNHWDSGSIFKYAMKFLKFLLNKYTADEIFTMVSEIEFIDAASVKFRGYDEEECGSDANTFGYVVDDKVRKWNHHHLSLFKIFRDKKAYYDMLFDGVAYPNTDLMIEYALSINFDNKTVIYSETEPIVLTFETIKL